MAAVVILHDTGDSREAAMRRASGKSQATWLPHPGPEGAIAQVLRTSFPKFKLLDLPADMTALLASIDRAEEKALSLAAKAA